MHEQGSQLAAASFTDAKGARCPPLQCRLGTKPGRSSRHSPFSSSCPLPPLPNRAADAHSQMAPRLVS